MELVFLIVVTVFLLVGVILALVPGIPAMLYLFIVSLTFGLADHFTHLSTREFSVLAGIYLVSLAVDLFSGAIGAKYGGASLRSALWGIVGAVIGTLAIPPFGGIFGLFLGVLVSELATRGDAVRALRAAAFGTLGALTGTLINLGLAILFFSWFFVAVFLIP